MPERTPGKLPLAGVAGETQSPAKRAGRTWRDKTPAELVCEKASDTNMLDVLKDPAKYANQKLRIVGNIRSGFEYSEFVDKDGHALGIWPDVYRYWSRFLEESGVSEDPIWAGTEGEDLGFSRAQTNLRFWPPAPKKPAKNVEYVGYLEWDGSFGHMGGWTREFTIVEQYPVDLDPSKRNAIHKAYLKFISALPAPAIPNIDAASTKLSAWDYGPLQGTWVVTRTEGLDDFADDFLGLKWIVFKDHMIISRVGTTLYGRFVVDTNKSPATVDWISEGSSDLNARGVGIYRIDGRRSLTVAWGDLPGVFSMSHAGGMRPTGFERTQENTPIVFSLERIAGPLRGLPPDEPKAVALLDDAATRDEKGNIVSLRYGDGAHGQRQVNDQLMSHFANLAHLESLSIRGPKVTDVGLGAIVGLASLRRLNIQDVSATGAGLRHLLESPELSDFSFSSEKATNAVIANVSRCPKLKVLWLSGNGITDAGVAQLGSMQQLRELSLASSAMTGAALSSLARLQDLRSLMVSDAPITSGDLAALTGMARLESLALTNPRVDSSIVKILPQFKTLKSLVLWSSNLEREELQPLVDKGLNVSLDGRWIETSSIAAAHNLVKQAVRGRLEAEGIVDPSKRRDALASFEISEADVLSLFGNKLAESVWAFYSRRFENWFAPPLNRTPRPDPSNLIEVVVQPATHPASRRRNGGLDSILPPGVEYLSASALYQEVPGARTQAASCGLYLIINGKAKHVSDPGRLFTAYRRGQLFRGG